MMSSLLSEASQVYSGVECLRAESPIGEQSFPKLPLWIGPLPEGTYTLVPVKLEPLTRAVDIRVDGEWQSFTYVSMLHPEVEGFTRQQGERCMVSFRKRLYHVHWKSHECEKPPCPMRAWEWADLLGKED